MGYPIILQLQGVPCSVVGGGAVAARKVKRLLTSRAQVTVIAPELTPVLQEMATAGKISWRQQTYVPGCLRGARLVFCTTAEPAVNREAAAEARAQGALVNDATSPQGSDFHVPASLQRGELLLTVSTGGGSPELARQIRRELETAYPEVFGAWLERLVALRQKLQHELSGPQQRQAFWRQALSGAILDFVRQGQLDRAEDELRHAITDFGTES